MNEQKFVESHMNSDVLGSFQCHFIGIGNSIGKNWSLIPEDRNLPMFKCVLETSMVKCLQTSNKNTIEIGNIIASEHHCNEIDMHAPCITI